MVKQLKAYRRHSVWMHYLLIAQIGITILCSNKTRVVEHFIIKGYVEGSKLFLRVWIYVNGCNILFLQGYAFRILLK